MKPLFLTLCCFISLNAAFAQSSSIKGSSQSSGEVEDTTVKVSLCTNSSGHQGFMVKNGKGQTEFQTVDQFVKSKSTAQSKKSISRTVGVNATTSSEPTTTKIKETVTAERVAGRDSSTILRPNKLPPALMQGPPQH